MENQDFKISAATVYLLVIGHVLLTITGAMAKILHWEYAQFLLVIGLVLFISTWLIILGDMIKSNMQNKTFWILSMFIIPSIASIIYLIRRNKLISPGQKYA